MFHYFFFFRIILNDQKGRPNKCLYVHRTPRSAYVRQQWAGPKWARPKLWTAFSNNTIPGAPLLRYAFPFYFALLLFPYRIVCFGVNFVLFITVLQLPNKSRPMLTLVILLRYQKLRHPDSFEKHKQVRINPF